MNYVILLITNKRGTLLVAQLIEALRYKVAVSIPEGVIGIFHCHNSSGRTTVVGSTYCLTEIFPTG